MTVTASGAALWVLGRDRQDRGFGVTSEGTVKPPSSGSAAGAAPRPRTRRKRARGPREAAEVGAGAARMMKGLVRRAQGGDLEALVALRDLEAVLALSLFRAAVDLNREHGYSWAEIALRLNTTKRAVYARWGER